MQITVVPEDRLIVKDGVPLVFDFPVDACIHAISWYGGSGDIERNTGGSTPCAVTDAQPFIDLYDAEIARLAAVNEQSAS